MNVKFEVHLFIEPEDYEPDNIANLAVNFSDIIVLLGYGNEAGVTPEETKLKSVLVVRPTEPGEWEENADTAMAINFPTEDDRFVAMADEGGIPEL